jgi:hypothetical protein
MKRHWLTAAAGAVAVLLGAAGCATERPTVCSDGFCSGPAHVTSTGDAIQNGIVAVLVTVGLAPVVPGSAGGPARVVRRPKAGS